MYIYTVVGGAVQTSKLATRCRCRRSLPAPEMVVAGSEAIERADHRLAAAIEHVRVDRRRAHLLVAKQLTDSLGGNPLGVVNSGN